MTSTSISTTGPAFAPLKKLFFLGIFPEDMLKKLPKKIKDKFYGREREIAKAAAK